MRVHATRMLSSGPGGSSPGCGLPGGDARSRIGACRARPRRGGM